MMEFKDNSGYFYEYDCANLYELKDLCNNTHCQTDGYNLSERMTRIISINI